MILLSKLIKSASTDQRVSNEKLIHLKSITPAFTHYDNGTDTNSSEMIESEGDYVHYNEQELIQLEKNRLEQQKNDLEREKEDWLQEKKQQQILMDETADFKANQAAEEGYNQGYSDAIEQVKKEYSAHIKQAENTVTVAKDDYLKKIESSEPIMLDLAITIAKKVIGETLADNEKSWLELLKKAVLEVREQEEVKLYVHPKWFELTLFHKNELQEIALHSRELLIYPDEYLQENGCIIETPYGQMDVSLDSQLLEIKKSLFEKLREGNSGEY
ncbi:flagellar assembly protein FliH [Salipaludibacillus neizhouensis]|uniref:Flagellar assembly protein FliH n=1 Tax=Salipaludibacillus neizhouensis TaxID=885475 RepID=A0A3A9KHF8_9BACI|nr:flagellar assembly protein FliH [Salipaludibacillus neizhouensis]